MTKRGVIIAFALFALATMAGSQGEPTKQVMRAKTRYAHRLLDAIVMEDFDTIRDQAFRLKAVAESADFRIEDTPEYVRESEDFIEATERLIQAAREQRGDGAALAYMDLTVKCVHCHRYLRSHLGER